MIAKIVTFIPVLIFGIVANFVIIRLIIQNRSLRTPSNLIIANMALANCLTLLICPVLFMINDFYQNFLLGSLGCKLEGFLEGALLITAVLNLAVVSYDRLTAIVLPSETRLSIRGTKIVICLTWLAGILIALPLALYRSYKVCREILLCSLSLNITTILTGTTVEEFQRNILQGKSTHFA